MKLLMALGGNALIEGSSKRNYNIQSLTVQRAAEKIAKIIEGGHEIIITHGNGPQVGDLEVQNEMANQIIPKLPLYVCVGMTQAQVGFMFQQHLNNEFIQRKIAKKAVTVVTQTLVHECDPLLYKPTKPVGPYYSKERAEKLKVERGEDFVFEKNKGYRKVVPSPLPVDIVEKELISDLFGLSYVVVATGGGGIPVIKKDKYYKGIEGVIDKDLTGALLAKITGVDVFMILTSVSHVMLDFGTAKETKLDKVSTRELKKYLNDGYFEEGSMAPKVKAAIQFVEGTGKKAIISSLEDVEEALKGKRGTHIEHEKIAISSRY